MTDLVLHLKKQWFDKIKSGEKIEEYRETTEYWQRSIQLKHFTNIVLLRGYPSTRTPENCMVFPWNGYVIKRIGSWERQEMIEVFAMPLKQEPHP